MAREGLSGARFILVLSSLSPVFLLWAIRGVDIVSDCVWVPICVGLFLLPNLFLWYQIRRARKVKNTKTIEVHSARDQREHLLVYLFAMLIPLYDVNLGGARELLAVVVAFAFVVFIFWHMKLHYLNVFLALRGYTIFTVETPSNGAKGSKDFTYALISKRHNLESGKPVTGYRLGGNVLVDTGDAGPRV